MSAPSHPGPKATRTPRPRRLRPRALLAALGLLAVTLWIALAAWHRVKPLPAGLSVAAPVRTPGDVRFLADRTWTDPAGKRRVEQRIFDRMLALVGQAERLVVADLFLFNAFAGEAVGADMRALSQELTAALVRRRAERPELRVIVITDPVNSFYGSFDPPHFQALRAAGVELVITDLGPLRASNPAWSGLWRLCCRWLGRPEGGGWLPNPLGGDAVALRSLLRLPLFKANHRKTLVVDAGERWIGLVTSANPHDASSAHSNVAVEFSGAAALDLLATERAVAAFSAPTLAWPAIAPGPAPAPGNGPRLQVLTEADIRAAVLASLAAAGPGDRVDLAMFYLAHRAVVDALVAARRRGAAVRALLDPNRDAFGREKGGIPNRPVAAELVAAGIDVRWCDTHGEQCHDKLMLTRFADGQAEVVAGSANFTRRNLDDLNLETSVRVLGAADSEFMREVARWFERRWSEPGSRNFSVPYAAYADEGWWPRWRYRFQEWTGLSTF